MKSKSNPASGNNRAGTTLESFLDEEGVLVPFREQAMQEVSDWQAAEAGLQADLAAGLADLAAGQVHAFDIKQIEELGRDRLSGRVALSPRTDE